MSPVPNGLLMLPPFMDGLGGLRPAFTPSTARSAVQTEPTLQNSAASLDALVASSGTRSRTPAGRLFAAAMRSLRAAHGDSAPRNPAKHIRVLERFVTGLNELEPRAVAIEFSRITETPVPPRQRAEVGRQLRTLLVAHCARLLGELRKADLEHLADSPR